MELIFRVTWLGKPIKPLGIGSVGLANIILILYQVWLYLPKLLSLLSLRSSEYIWQLLLRAIVVVAISESFLVPRGSTVQIVWSMIPWFIMADVHILLQMLLQVRRQGYHLV